MCSSKLVMLNVIKFTKPTIMKTDTKGTYEYMLGVFVTGVSFLHNKLYTLNMSSFVHQLHHNKLFVKKGT